MAPLAIGGALATQVYAGGPVSGGVYNPAVAIAAVMQGILEPAKAGLYVAAQLVGALKAGCVYAYVLNGHKVSEDKGYFASLYGGDEGVGEIGHPAAGDGVAFTTALLAEVIGTCLLVYTVLSVATVDDTKDNDYFGIAIGFAVVVAAATVGGVSGGAFNPAVSMLSVVAGKSATIAVYWAGPALGAVLGTGLFKTAYKGESKKKSKRKTR